MSAQSQSQSQAQPLAPRVARRFASFGQSVFARYTALALQHNAINLSQGFPDFDGPELAKIAAKAAIDSGHNQYAPMTGVKPVRDAIARQWEASGRFAIDADNWVTVTCGCSEAIGCTMAGLLNPEDEIVIFQPFFDFYEAGVAWAGCGARYVTLHAPRTSTDPFTFDVADLRRAITPRTRAILLNTPHNPTGKVFTRSELESIAALCIEHDLVCISDEVYEHLLLPGSDGAAPLPHISIATLPGMRERTITLSSLGKSFSLTGWKVGWAIAPPHLSAAVRAAHQFMTFSSSTPMQHGAVAVLDRASALAKPLVELFARNRDVLSAALSRAGLTPLRSDSTYFVMADHSAVSAQHNLPDDEAFCQWLTREVGVASIPPSVFYKDKALGRNLVRFAFCKKAETIDAACERLRTKLG
jgi:aspartate/methionine/tyrosine aminotransferase